MSNSELLVGGSTQVTEVGGDTNELSLEAPATVEVTLGDSTVEISILDSAPLEVSIQESVLSVEIDSPLDAGVEVLQELLNIDVFDPGYQGGRGPQGPKGDTGPPATAPVWLPQPSATPSENGELLIEATSNTSLTVKLRGSDGIVRSINLTLL